MSHEYRMEQLRAAIAAARKNFKKDANFFVVGLTYGCLKSWILMILTPAALQPNAIPRFKAYLDREKIRLSDSSP